MFKNKKDNACIKLYEYRSIPGIPDDYLNYLLVSSVHKDVLGTMLFKECESQLIKGLMYKHKINKKSNPANEQLIDLALEFIEKDKKRELYNRANSFNNGLLIDFLEIKDLENVLESKENFMNEIQSLVEIIDFPHLLCYIRSERCDLFDIAPMLLAMWRKSNRYEMEEYREDFDFDVELWFERAKENNIDVDFDKVIKKMGEQRIIDLDDENFLEATKESNIDETVKMVKEYLDILVRKSKLHQENYEKSLKMEDKLNEAEKVLTKTEKKIKSVEKKLIKANDETERLVIELEQVKQKNESLEISLNEKNDKIEELKKEKKENSKKTRELNNKLTKLTKEFDEYKSKQKEKEKDDLAKEEAVKLIVAENKELEEKCKQLSEQLSEIKLQQIQTNKSYEEEIELLKSKSINTNIYDEPIKDVAATDEVIESDMTDFNYDDLFGDDLDNNPTY